MYLKSRNCVAHTQGTALPAIICMLGHKSRVLCIRYELWGAVSYGAMSPAIFVKEGSRLLPTTSAKGKLGRISEVRTGQRALKVHQSGILGTGQRAMCVTGQNSWALDGRIIKRFMSSVATHAHCPWQEIQSLTGCKGGWVFLLWP